MHRHSRSEASILLAGSAMDSDRTETDANINCDMRLKPTDYRHSVKFGPNGALFLAIKLNPSQKLQELGLDNGKVMHSPIPSRDFISQICRALQFDALQPDELEAEIAGLFGQQLADISHKRYQNPPAWLKYACELLEQSNLGITAIAAELGIHRVHLSRVFSQHFQMPMSEYRRKMHLAKAMNSLLQSRATLADTAYGAGFVDQSHLNRELSRLVGITPGKIRQVMP